ncbi:MAG: CopG family transcriptional regulator [Candidatus Bathyarchaeia archaeon]
MSEKVGVPLSKELLRKVQREVKQSGGEFKSIPEYIEFVLRELLEEEPAYTTEEEEKIKERLRALGYIE